MGITSSNKVVDRSEVSCDGEFQVTLALTAAPDIIENPTDIVLVLDRSGSMSGVPLAAQGRIIQLEVTVKDVCPNRRVALGVMLEEVGPDGKTEPRGFKAYTIPAHTQPGCRDIQVQCIRFVVPEDVSLWGKSLCDTRRFQVQLIAQEMDWDFNCP